MDAGSSIKGVIAALAVLAGLPAHAASPAWSDNAYSFFLDDVSVSELLSDLGSREGIPVSVDASVTDTVSARFEEVPAAEIFDRVVSAYALQWYYDGHVLHVDRVVNSGTETIQLTATSVAAFRQHLEALGVFDERFYWGGADAAGVLVVSGPNAYVERVLQLADMFERRNRGVDVLYTWVDENGQTHFSSSTAEAPEDARMVRMPRGEAGGAASGL